ncbi:hypothetical protein HYV64_05370 [Candidatus Shapirobacteria bacterium]|nr:hypothetical protein [Candidatus Shapirobacteria bacterium]
MSFFNKVTEKAPVPFITSPLIDSVAAKIRGGETFDQDLSADDLQTVVDGVTSQFNRVTFALIATIEKAKNTTVEIRQNKAGTRELCIVDTTLEVLKPFPGDYHLRLNWANKEGSFDTLEMTGITFETTESTSKHAAAVKKLNVEAIIAKALPEPNTMLTSAIGDQLGLEPRGVTLTHASFTLTPDHKLHVGLAGTKITK